MFLKRYFVKFNTKLEKVRDSQWYITDLFYDLQLNISILFPRWHAYFLHIAIINGWFTIL